jgi:hypothetical protein
VAFPKAEVLGKPQSILQQSGLFQNPVGAETLFPTEQAQDAAIKSMVNILI